MRKLNDNGFVGILLILVVLFLVITTLVWGLFFLIGIILLIISIFIFAKHGWKLQNPKALAFMFAGTILIVISIGGFEFMQFQNPLQMMGVL